MNKKEMEEYLVDEAKKDVEAAVFRIGDLFYPVGCIRLGKDNFIADPKDVTRILDTGDPDLFIHTHLNCSSEPSQTDLDIKELWPMEWHIYSIMDGEINDIRRIL